MKQAVNEILARLTLEEKAGLCSGQSWWMLKGVERLGLPSIMVTDGPHGLRRQADGHAIDQSVPATCFPTAVGLAATWDRELVREIGVALGEECQQEGVAVLLGPGINIKRSPLCGRNFEYFSEDPYVAGEIAAAFIDGVQSQGVGTSLKHFAVNNQEYRRLTIDALVDERALREIYLAGFERAIQQAKPWTVMTAYNQVDGSYAGESEHLMRTILRGEWGFGGLAVSDWGAVNDRVQGLRTGLDLEMPTSFGYTDQQLVEAVQSGELDKAELDASAGRVIELILKHRASRREGYRYDVEAHHQLARRAAADSMVLLKNEAAILPLASAVKLGLIGEFAKIPRYQGAGSSQVNPIRLDTALDALRERASSQAGLEIQYAKGYQARVSEPNQQLIDEACAVARAVDVVVIMAGLPDVDEAEGFDRTHLEMPEAHHELIRQVARHNPNIVLALCNGAPVQMPWLGEAKAVLETYLAGQASGSALWDIVFGDVNPSGKLAETFPLALSDSAANAWYPMGPTAVEYRESVYVGYRYYDSAKRDCLFYFGHGLSYTRFEYAQLELSCTQMMDVDELKVRCRVSNAGDRFGKEVVQLYVRDVESSIFRPDKELKGFAKVSLAPGESTVVELTLDKRAFAYYNVELQDWQVESGEFEILIGASSRDIRLSERVVVEAVSAYDERLNDRRAELPSYYELSKLPAVSREEFEALYGRSIQHAVPSGKGNFHRNSTIEDLQTHVLGKRIYRAIMREVRRQVSSKDAQTVGVMQAFVREQPLRNLTMLSFGKVTPRMTDSLIEILNGRIWRGLRKLVGKQ